ncbi:MAG TPA: AI-2E family transporter [Methylococcales bacterium]|nr:AI-2E family transporter [Methylococcales bacterium]
MSELNKTLVTNDSAKDAVDTAIRISLIALLAYWCFLIFKPFLIPVLWGIIIAAAIFPLFQKFEALFGKQKKLALILFTTITLSILLVPCIMLIGSMAETGQALAKAMQEGTLQIPPPSEKVAGWPVVGESIYDVWKAASDNLVATLGEYKPQLKTAATWLVSATAGTVGSLLQFIIAIIIASVFIANANQQKQFSKSLFVRIAGKAGNEFAELASATMRSVAQGVLGVAFIQAMLAGIGLLIMDVPGAGLLTLGVLLLAVIQLPTILLLGPVMIYVFSVADPVPAVIFIIWTILVGLSDNILKPLLMGRGMDIPMLIILLGAIGGMMLHGLIGLFIGAVVLAIAYKLFIKWLEQNNVSVEE